MKKGLLFFVGFFYLCSCVGQVKESFTTDDYVRLLKQATDVMVNDATSPVAASRYYAYINLAANETAVLFNKEQPRFEEDIKAFKGFLVEDTLIKKADPQLTVLFALNKSARRLLPSGYLLENNIDSLKIVAGKKKITEKKINASLRIADKAVDHILKYAGTDGFNKLSGMRRFTPSNGDAYWQPTAPGFMAALEPYWNTLRTFIIDSCSQFGSPPPYNYSADTSSAFFKELKEVYDVSKKITPQQSAIASFWDCNPFALQQIGHLEFALKKISPGGHWIGITGIACKKRKLTFYETAYVHAIVSIGLADAFISCWNDKYRYNLVRPVTAIKNLIDKSWSPLLQTPPFPEWTSGHSVISTTAATILTHVLGDNFSFTDDTEVEFGLPIRSFNSFLEASAEAAVSRFYGGIHYYESVKNGVTEGEQIGKLINSRCTVAYPDKKSNKKK